MMRKRLRWLVLVLAAASCQRGTSSSGSASSSEEAAERFQNAVKGNDAPAAYEVLHERTRLLIEQVRQTHQRCLQMIDGGYPTKLKEVADQERGRFIAAATAPAFFRAYDARYGMLRGFREHALGHLTLNQFAKGSDGSWGFTNLELQWQDISSRYRHLEKVVKENLATLAQSPLK